MNNRNGAGRRGPKPPAGTKGRGRGGPPRSSGDGGRGSRSDRPDRGSGNPLRGPGVEKPERHFGTKARGSQWGGVARRGAHNASIDPGGPRPQSDDAGMPPTRDGDKWERQQSKTRTTRPNQKRTTGAAVELDAAHTQNLPKAERARLLRRVGEAGEHFLADRFGEVDDILRPIIKKYPQIPELHELYGLTLYRLGRWSDALERLQYFTDVTGDIDQFPVMADCYRALGEVQLVRKLWDELRVAGPEAGIMTEGRIVMAGTLADTGDVAGGIRLLERGPIKTKKPRDHHVRLWYALADLYERAGDHQRARRGFERIEQVEPGYADVADRLNSLS
ncbi:MAG: tetratricopeptide repeat protein [Candidatus Poriferisodalaceae bacterium]|nr:MAG: hypothetical protein CNE88_03350 [Acidimicrobiales bacterium MED-G01]